MAITQGPLIDAAFKKATTWGTEVDCDVAGAKLRLLRESITEQVTKFPNLSLHGSSVPLKDERGRIAYGGQIEMLFDFHQDMLLSHFLGTAGTPAQVAATTAYTNTLSWNNTLRGIFGTLCIEKTVDLWEYDTVSVVGIHLLGRFGEAWRLQYDLLCRKLQFDGSTPLAALNDVITAATFGAAVSPPVIMPWKDTKTQLRINSVAGALDANAVVSPETMELHLTRTMRQIFTSADGPYQSEPADNGFMEGSLRFTLPLYEAISYHEALDANTTYKADITLNGETDSIESGQDYQMVFILPLLNLVSAPATVAGPETVQHPLEFKVVNATANPTGMADTEPYITLKNKRTTTPLA